MLMALIGTILLLLLALVSPLTTGQHGPSPTTTAPATSTNLLVFASSALPQCATACEPLYAAQYACIPPGAPTTSPSTYKSCFCQSGYLAGLYNSPNGVCDAACPGGLQGLGEIQRWYVGFCRPETVSTSGSVVVTGITAVLLGTPTGDSMSSGGAATATSAVAGGGGVTGKQKSWWFTHWNWVLMLILLTLFLSLIAIGGVWLKRRYKRKQQSKSTTSLEDMGAVPPDWGPLGLQHLTKGFDHVETEKDGVGGGREGSERSEKGKGKATIIVEATGVSKGKELRKDG
ncbi:MAG: hypothetical protein M1827_006896 [Pycnora praestabilis]|nr:MAG: hypothetical protein M1827_006896 [Pycnora praestabilis]